MRADSARNYLDELIGWASAGLSGDEVLLAHLSGEDSDFVRFNHAAVRQAGHVTQRTLSFDLIAGTNHAEGSVSLSGDVPTDHARMEALLSDLRVRRSALPPDPHLLYSTGSDATERLIGGAPPEPGDAVDAVVAGAEGRDLVGIYAAGQTFRGFASSLGQRNWFSAATFNLEWSMHLHADKATKNAYAGMQWNREALNSKLDWSIRELEALGRTARTLPPGGYRAYLAPAAMQEILGMLAWDGFGLRAHRTMQTPLLRMITEGAEFHPSVSISEDFAGGVAPDFQSAGFSRPGAVSLVDGGQFAGHLVSPRSAQEYSVDTNGAEDHEFPVAIAMEPGNLPTDRVLSELGTGLYVGNLWYLNFSDRAACRTTGMTRFGTFWVEGGEIVAPVDVLRFDDTAYHLLGDRLGGLTDQAETILDSSTYEERSMESFRVPGALIEEMTFTL